MKHYDGPQYSVHNSVGYLMRRGASLLREQLEASFADAGITFVQWATLIMLRDNPSLTAADLCRDLRHDSGAFTRLVDHLEQRQLLKRVRSDEDRRTVHLLLSSSGREMIERHLPLVVDRLNHALSDFTPAEVATLTSLLTRMIARLEESPAVSGDRP
jgi:DNA-binding MarR family transcriptional regulator